MPEKITSLQNTLIKRIGKLKDGKARRKSRLSVVEGVREISGAYAAGVSFEHILICPDYLEGKRNGMVAKLLKEHSSKVVETTVKVYDKVAFGERREGILGVFAYALRHINEMETKSPVLAVVADNMEKPGNFGAILRTADAVGVDAVILCDPHTDLYNPNVIRSSVGSVFSVDVYLEERKKALAHLRENNIRVIATSPSAKDLYTDCDFSGDICFVIGSENKGVSPFWSKNADRTVKIPMRGAADSLNASSSAAVLLYEALRQRTQ